MKNFERSIEDEIYQQTYAAAKALLAASDCSREIKNISVKTEKIIDPIKCVIEVSINFLGK